MSTVEEVEQNIESLISLALQQLPATYNKTENLVCFTMKPKKGEGFELHGRSLRYSAIALIGLLKARSYGYLVSIDLEQFQETLVKRADRTDNLGDIGLICWAIALDGNKKYYRKIADIACTKWSMKREKYATMELQWLLTGLCYLYQRFADNTQLKNVIHQCYTLLLESYSDKTGLFGFFVTNGVLASLKIWWKRRLTDFAEQAYGIYSLSTYYETFQHQNALDLSLRIAQKICSDQGDYGQWWWLYDVYTGDIVDKYPVSV